MNRRRLALALCALLLALGLTGCGGGDADSDAADGDTTTPSSTPTSAAPLSKTDFLDQANMICKLGNTVINASVGGLDLTDKDAVSDAVTTTLVPGIRQQIAEIRALGYPEGDEQTIEDALTGAEDVLDMLEADPSLLLKGQPFKQSNKALDAYGLIGCGSKG